MQRCPFSILRQPVAILVTVSLILIKVNNDCFIFYIQKVNRSLSKTDDAIRREITNVLHPLIISQDLFYAVLNRLTSLIP